HRSSQIIAPYSKRWPRLSALVNQSAVPPRDEEFRYGFLDCFPKPVVILVNEQDHKPESPPLGQFEQRSQIRRLFLGTAVQDKLALREFRRLRRVIRLDHRVRFAE